MDIKECLEQRFLVKTEVSDDLIKKELDEASYDLDRAEGAFKEEDWKWTIIQSYYSMFHAARAVLFKLGLREKRHFAIGIVLEDLNKKGKLESEYVDNFNAALASREDADYHYIHNKESAKQSLEISNDFLNRMGKLLKELK